MSVKITEALTPPPAFTRLRDVTPPAGDGSDDGRAWVWDPAAGKFRSGVVSTFPVPTPLPVVHFPTGGTVQDFEARLAIHDIIWALQAAGIIAPSGAFTDVSLGDSFALRELYAATDGPNWTNNTGWAPGTVGYTGLAADARGVTVAGGRVTEILLLSNNLQGEAPLGGLTSLTFLSFFGNQLTAVDAENTSLTEFHVAKNQLVLLDLSTNTHLTVVSCHNNQLKSLGVSETTSLTELFCHTNQLTAAEQENTVTGLYVDRAIRPATLISISNQTDPTTGDPAPANAATIAMLDDLATNYGWTCTYTA